MRDWTRVTIAELLAGQWPGEWGSEPEVGSDGAVVYRSTELDDDGHVRQSTVNRSIIASKLSAKKLAPGDILLEASGGTPGRAVGRVGLYAPENPELAICSNFLRTLRPKADVCGPYIRWVLMQLHRQPEVWRFQQQTTGMSNLHVKGYLRHTVYIAPLPQQRRIAETLSALDEAISQTEALIAKTQAIKAGLMHDLFTRGLMPDGHLRSPREEVPKLYKKSPIGWIPKEWDVASLGDVSNLVTSGSRGWASYYSEEGAQFIRIGNLTREHPNLRIEDLVYVQPPLSSEGQRTRLVEGDLLISITADLGIIAVVPMGLGEAYINQHIALIRLRPELVSCRWLGHWLGGTQSQERFQSLNDSGAKAGLNLPTIRALGVALPTREEQNIAVSRLDSADEAVHAARTSVQKLQTIKAGLMHDLLTGRVRVPVPEERSSTGTP